MIPIISLKLIDLFQTLLFPNERINGASTNTRSRLKYPVDCQKIAAITPIGIETEQKKLIVVEKQF